MKRLKLVAIAALVSIVIGVRVIETRSTTVRASGSSAEFDSNGRLLRPTGVRAVGLCGCSHDARWTQRGGRPVFLNTITCTSRSGILTPISRPSFPEGTVIVKELTRVLDPKFPDGSRTEPSGRGYFNREFNGLDVTVKDSKRFVKTNGWGFFNFGHHPEPYAESAEEASASECASCHMTFVAKTDMTWVQFYPMLRNR